MGKSDHTRCSGPRPLATRLELTSVTPGAISAAVIIICNPHYSIPVCGRSLGYRHISFSLQTRCLPRRAIRHPSSIVKTSTDTSHSLWNTLTGGEGAWKPTKISWVHCRLWLKVPTTYPLITDWVHSKCSQIMCSTWNLWEHLCNIWNFPNDILKMFPPHAQWEHLKFV